MRKRDWGWYKVKGHVDPIIEGTYLRLSADIIAPSLTYIINLSLDTGIYIDDWKRARVSPIYKSKDRLKCEHYRPISILPVISKVFRERSFDSCTIIFLVIHYYPNFNHVFDLNTRLSPRWYKCVITYLKTWMVEGWIV